jgi:membrane-associated phospholipid phosphatase
MRECTSSTIWRVVCSILVVGALVHWSLPVCAGGEPSLAEPERERSETEESLENDFVPLSDNFSAGELSLIGASTLAAMAVGYWGEHIFEVPGESFPPPARDSVDWKVTVNVNPDPDLTDLGWWRVADHLGDPLLVAGAGVYYGFGAVGTWLMDANWVWDTRHELFAFAGAISTMQIVVQSSKLAFGRQRPRIVRGCNPPSDPCGEFDIPPEKNVELDRQDVYSFPGGHTGSAAAAMSFIYLDLSDYLVYDVLAESSPATRFWIGRVLPVIPTYGFVALSFYERLYSQEHWLSDQVVGTVLGLGAGNAFYLIHFDSTGKPRRDRRTSGDVADTSPLDEVQSHLLPVVLAGGELGVGWRLEW